VVLHFAVDEAVFAPDQKTYHWAAAQILAYWNGERIGLPAMLQVEGPKAYYYLVAAVYGIVGPWALVPKLINAVLGASTVPLSFRLALRISGSEAVALRSAAYVAYFPSLILYEPLETSGSRYLSFLV